MSYWIAGAAAVGALADKKQPLRGAALGAGAMMTGGAALGAGGAAAAGGSAAGGAAGAAGMGGGTGLTLGAGGATGLTAGGSTAAAGMGGGSGLLASGSAMAPTAGASSGGFMASLQPYMQAAGSASQVKGLLSDDGPQIQAPQVAQGNPQGAQTLAQLYQQGTQMSPEMQARMQRKTMWG